MATTSLLEASGFNDSGVSSLTAVFGTTSLLDTAGLVAGAPPAELSADPSTTSRLRATGTAAEGEPVPPIIGSGTLLATFDSTSELAGTGSVVTQLLTSATIEVTTGLHARGYEPVPVLVASRMVFPDQGSQLVYSRASEGGIQNEPLLSAAHRTITIYLDDQQAVLADIRTLANDPIPGSEVEIGAGSVIPYFLGPDDGTDTLYDQYGNAIAARVDDRLDFLATAMGTIETSLANQLGLHESLGHPGLHPTFDELGAILEGATTTLANLEDVFAPTLNMEDLFGLAWSAVNARWEGRRLDSTDIALSSPISGYSTDVVQGVLEGLATQVAATVQTDVYYLPSGSGDRTAELQTLFDAIDPDNGGRGGTVVLPSERVEIHTFVEHPAKVFVQGGPNTVVVFYRTSQANPPNWRTRSNTAGVAAAIALTADAHDGDSTLTITDTSTLAVHDFLLVGTPSANALGEQVEVREILSSTQVLINGVLRDQYLQTDGAKVQKITFMEGVGMDQIVFDHNAPAIENPSNVGTGVMFLFTKGTIVTRCRVRNQGFYPMTFAHCRQFVCLGYQAEQLADADRGGGTLPQQDGYGVSVNGSEDGLVIGCIFRNLRSGFITGGALVGYGAPDYGVTRNVVVTGCVATGCFDPFGSHPGAESIHFAGNSAINSTFGYSQRARNSSVIGNRASWCTNGIRIIGDSTQGPGAFATVAIGNHVRHMRTPIADWGTQGSGDGIVLSGIFGSAVVSDNDISDCDGGGVLVGTGTHEMNNVHVLRNRIFDGGKNGGHRNGIAIASQVTGSGLVIKHNQIGNSAPTVTPGYPNDPVGSAVGNFNRGISNLSDNITGVIEHNDILGPSIQPYQEPSNPNANLFVRHNYRIDSSYTEMFPFGLGVVPAALPLAPNLGDGNGYVLVDSDGSLKYRKPDGSLSTVVA